MKIRISKLSGEVFMEGWHIKENETGFYAKLSKQHGAYFKFPWKLFKYEIMEKQ